MRAERSADVRPASITPMTTADVLEAPPPRLTTADAEGVARTAFGIEATAKPLVSERDQSFRSPLSTLSSR